MTVAQTTRERILRHGLDLLSQAGLSGVTLGVLAERVGMSKSGLFAHFRSKDDVQIGLLDYMKDFADGHVVAPAMKAPPGLPRLEALVSHWCGWAERAGLPGGCPVAAGLFELDDVESPVRDKILAMESEWRRLLEQLVRDAIAEGHLRRGLDIEQFIWELNGIYLSHHASHRFFRQAEADTRARTAFRSLIEHSRPLMKSRVATQGHSVVDERPFDC